MAHDAMVCRYRRPALLRASSPMYREEVLLLRDSQPDGCSCSTIFTVVSSSVNHVSRHWPRGTEKAHLCMHSYQAVSFLLVTYSCDCKWDRTAQAQRGNDVGDADGRAGACEARTQWISQLRLDRESGFRAAWRGYPLMIPKAGNVLLRRVFSATASAQRGRGILVSPIVETDCLGRGVTGAHRGGELSVGLAGEIGVPTSPHLTARLLHWRQALWH